MIWSRLKNCACPKCGAMLNMSMLDPVYACTNEKCDFVITTKRFDEIITDMYQPKPRRCATGENLAALNNLGHEVMSEDFSDRL